MAAYQYDSQAETKRCLSVKHASEVTGTRLGYWAATMLVYSA